MIDDQRMRLSFRLWGVLGAGEGDPLLKNAVIRCAIASDPHLR